MPPAPRNAPRAAESRENAEPRLARVFQDDPLIREALEIFKGEIKTVNRLTRMNLNKLMKQAQKMQEQMAKTQAELEEKTVEVRPPAARSRSSRTARATSFRSRSAKEIVDPEDVEFLEGPDPERREAGDHARQGIGERRDDKITGGLGLGGPWRLCDAA